jgi:hypothetical protein
MAASGNGWGAPERASPTDRNHIEIRPAVAPSSGIRGDGMAATRLGDAVPCRAADGCADRSGQPAIRVTLAYGSVGVISRIEARKGCGFPPVPASPAHGHAGRQHVPYDGIIRSDLWARKGSTAGCCRRVRGADTHRTRNFPGSAAGWDGLAECTEFVQGITFHPPALFRLAGTKNPGRACARPGESGPTRIRTWDQGIMSPLL